MGTATPNPCVQQLHADYRLLHAEALKSGAMLDRSLRLFLLETGHPVGTKSDRKWVTRLHEYEAFLAAYDRVPSHRAAAERPGSAEAALYRWGKRQLEATADLCAYQYTRLLCVPVFANRLDDAPLRGRAREYAEWTALNGPPRSRSTNPIERSLYDWRVSKRMQWRNRNTPGSRFTAVQQRIMEHYLGKGWATARAARRPRGS